VGSAAPAPTGVLASEERRRARPDAPSRRAEIAYDAAVAKTTVEVRGGDFWLNGQPTYQGRFWDGHRVEGLLFNSRMVQATFDDLNPDTRARWAYPDTGVWDPERNTDELVAMLPEYRRHGLLAVTLNLQGGSPESYSRLQPWINTAFTAYGELRPAYMARLARILDRLDELGMVAIVGLFYFGQDEKLYDEGAVTRSVDNATSWLLERGYQNVVVEINNECDVPRYEHPILHPVRVHELIERVKAISRDGRRLYAGTSMRGRSVPSINIVAASDVLFLHGNGVTNPAFIGEMVQSTRALPGYREKPIVFNEDDHFDFEKPENNMVVATRYHASWGYFDAGPGAGGSTARSDYVEGYQNVPVNWGINTERKRGFFGKVKEITGA
jgi:hypothetical protein